MRDTREIKAKSQKLIDRGLIQKLGYISLKLQTRCQNLEKSSLKLENTNQKPGAGKRRKVEAWKPLVRKPET